MKQVRARVRAVEGRLRGLRLKRAGSRLAADRAEVWRRPFFEALGLVRLRGTIRYPGAVYAADLEVHLDSRVLEIRMHGF